MRLIHSCNVVDAQRTFVKTCLKSFVLWGCRQKKSVVGDNYRMWKSEKCTASILKIHKFLDPIHDSTIQYRSSKYFIVNDTLMGGWIPNTCTSAYEYAHSLANAIRIHVKKGSNVIMFGLGGGYVGGLLSNEYSLVTVEISKDVIRRARQEAFPLMKQCGYKPDNMKLVHGDAHKKQNITPLKGFHAMILDIPSTYEHGLLSAFEANKHLLAPGAIVACNFWDNVRPYAKDLIYKYSEAVKHPMQYTAVYEFSPLQDK